MTNGITSNEMKTELYAEFNKVRVLLSRLEANNETGAELIKAEAAMAADLLAAEKRQAKRSQGGSTHIDLTRYL